MKVVSFGPTNTTPSPDTEIPFAVKPIAKKDLIATLDDPGVTIYSDITSPLDQPSTIRFSVRENKNVYAGSSVDPSAMLPTKKGTDIVIQIMETHAVTDDTDSTYLKMYPVKATLTLSAPSSSLVTPESLERLIKRIVASITPESDVTLQERLGLLQRGITERA